MTGRRHRSLSEPRSISGLLLLALAAFCRSNGQSQVSPQLDLKIPVQSRPAPGEARSWQIAGNSGDFFRISVQPNGLLLRIQLIAPDGSQAANIANRADESGPFPFRTSPNKSAGSFWNVRSAPKIFLARI